MQGLYGAIKLAPYILGGELDVEHGGMDLGVAHESHEGRKRDAGAHHVGAESVSEAMGIGFRDGGELAVMAKQRAKPGRRQGFSTVWTFEDDKKGGGVRERPFHVADSSRAP